MDDESNPSAGFHRRGRILTGLRSQWSLRASRSHGRYRDARLVVHTALSEGPRYDLYELRASSTHSNLETLWRELHEALGEMPAKSSVEIYNGGAAGSGSGTGALR